MPPQSPPAHWFTSHRRTVLIVDVVESVRLIEQDQLATVTRWLDVVRHAETLLAETGSGRKVKSLGDGMLLDLDGVPEALRIAFALQDFVQRLNERVPQDARMHLRIGLETGDLIVDQHDVYGHEVNVAARLAALDAPGEIVASAAVRDLLVAGVDADIEDLGECFLKHIRKPVRAYRLAPPGSEGMARRMPAVVRKLLPTVAVIPLRSDDASGALGQVVAEELIRAFGQSPYLNVISRLSTAAFARGERSLEEIGELLDASHVLTGTAIRDGDMLGVSLELSEVRSRQVAWSGRFREKAAHVLMGEQEMISRIAEEVGTAILNRELHRARALPVRTLESYTLMLSALHAMHRMSRSDFDLAERMLEAVIDRNPRHSVPLAWLGQWHVLKVHQGWTESPRDEHERASAYTARALDLNPDCEQALTIDGSVSTNLAKDFDSAEQKFASALRLNPNNPLANLLKSTMHSFRGEGDDAIRFSQAAQRRSPLDPNQYYFDCLTAAAYIAAEQPREAVFFAERSLKANATHTSTLRTLAVAQWMNGDEDAARASVAKLTALEPELTVSRWERNNPSASYRVGQQVAEILRAAGLPA